LHPYVADLYEVKVTGKSGGLAVEWQALDGRQSWQRAREGACLLRTNLPPDKPENLWKNVQERESARAPHASRQGRKHYCQMTRDLLPAWAVPAAQLTGVILAGLLDEAQNRLIALLVFVLRVVALARTHWRP
jgi:hypothetical protein